MNQFIEVDPWRIIDKRFDSKNQLHAESIFSIGNGKMGQRANFEEDYSGESLTGNYIAGIYYPDKTKVGWWKNGYPEYFAKVLNAVNWIGLHISIDGKLLDLAKCEINNFERILNMKEGVLKRNFTATMDSGKTIEVKTIRFYSMADDNVAVLSYSVKAINFSGTIVIESYLDFNVRNQDSNYDEYFWTSFNSDCSGEYAWVSAQTKKTNYQVDCGMRNLVFANGVLSNNGFIPKGDIQKVSHRYEYEVVAGDEILIEKYVSIVSSFYYKRDILKSRCKRNVAKALDQGFLKLHDNQKDFWAVRWGDNDITIQGDDAAQQAIRFNIFQLNQTYSGKDHRLNIGPKGFTGEKYGGSTYWDTEAYCLPFFLSTASSKVARNLLLYRYKHLEKAIENAKLLGFNAGAALYPMVTMNGEECHNEWEITFEEIHRNGAIAFAIFDYIRYTGDRNYLLDFGLEVLIAISRFWAQRVHFSKEKNLFVMHGVTGPNEYENNVNNNWYTSYIAQWCLKYTLESIESYKNDTRILSLFKKINFDPEKEKTQWKGIINNIYLPEDESKGIFVQHDGFLDKEIIPVSDLDNKHLPIVHHWSWDRILRSCYIKQADVLQGLYLFEDQFSKEEIECNFDFYEPLTVHESSLSPCVHSILAASINRPEKAYEMFIQTARLDLDDFNDDSKDGCHITSMAGTWMAFVKGLGGMRIYNESLSFHPVLPAKWDGYSFTIRFRNTTFKVIVKKEEIEIVKDGDTVNEIILFGKKEYLNTGSNVIKR